MQIFKTVLLVSLIIGVSIEVSSAKSNTLTKKQLKQYKPLKANEGKALKSLTSAKLSDVHLAKPVKYFDIKFYKTRDKVLTYKSYTGGWSFDMNSYKELTDKEKKKIRLERPVMSHYPFGDKRTNEYATSHEICNLHYIDIHSKVHTFASHKELLTFLGTIDTPTELHMVLLNKYGKIRYKKKGNLYIIRRDAVTYINYEGSEYDCSISVYHEIMDNRGNMLLEKEISDRKYRGAKCYDLQ